MNHCLLFGTFLYYHARTSGMHRIATHLRQQDWNVECIDFAAAWSLDELKLLAQSRITKNTKFIGFSILFDQNWSDDLTNFCLWIKSMYPDLLIISGGQGRGVLDMLAPVDYHIMGYGEYGLDALLAYKFSNGPRPKFSLTTSRTKTIESLHNYPAYPFRDPQIKYEDRDFIHPEEWLGIEFSRGCKFECDYCNYPVLGVKGDYSRTAESFKTQITDAYNRFGIKNYYVSDETFNDRTEKISKFADVVDSLDFIPYFTGFIRTDLMVQRSRDREELLRMNFLGHYYGIESFNRESAKAVGKGMDSAKLQQGLIECKNYFQKNSNNLYRGTIGLIVGLPHETIDSLGRTTNWLNANWLDQTATSYPLHIGTNNFERPSKMSLNYKKYGYEIADDGDFSYNSASKSTTLNWKSTWMDLQTATNYSKVINSTKQWRKYDAFSLAKIQENNNGELLTLEEKLSSLQNYSTNKLFLRNYITKKLNWVGG